EAGMRIVYYLERVSLADGGVARAVLDMAAVMAKLGEEVQVATVDGMDLPDEWWSGGPGLPQAVKICDSTGFLGRLGADGLQKLEQILRPADVLHLQGPWEFSNFQAAEIARAAGVPYLVSSHGMLDDWSMAQKAIKKRLYHTLFAGPMLRRATRVHTTAKAERDQVSKWAPVYEDSTIPYIMDLEPFRELPGPDLALEAFPALRTEKLKLLFLSRLHVKKGVDVALRELALLRDRGLDSEFYIAGTGEDAYVSELHQQVEQLDLSDRVHFLGLVTGEAKLSLFQACDLMLLPTSQENFGLALTESIACATPVVTTRGTDIWRELEESGGAAIVDRESGSFADAIRDYASDRSMLAERGEQARKYVFDWLDPEVVGERFRNLYATVSEAKVRAGAA
ncbi:MAG: glycosyltransferase, partial [Planctomycetota bacterium]